MKKILVVEDDKDIREGTAILLRSEGYEVLEAETGSDALRLLDEDVSLVILDIMLPDISGIQVCESMRSVSFVPILFLTARSLESDKLIGLLAGGDDYLTKPFSFAELLGRVKALIRRYSEYNSGGGIAVNNEDDHVNRGGIRLNRLSNEVFVDGREVMLTELEYKILKLLMEYPGKVFSAENIYESVWEEPYFHSCNGTVVVHIRKLRVKLGNPEYIKTVWGKGYSFGK